MSVILLWIGAMKYLPFNHYIKYQIMLWKYSTLKNRNHSQVRASNYANLIAVMQQWWLLQNQYTFPSLSVYRDSHDFYLSSEFRIYILRRVMLKIRPHHFPLAFYLCKMTCQHAIVKGQIGIEGPFKNLRHFRISRMGKLWWKVWLL